MITSHVSSSMRSLLEEDCVQVVEVQPIDSGDAVHLALLARPELGITLTKVHCWTLTDYTKCVFLDADTLVVQNCDELFEREELAAAPDAGWPDCFNSGVFVFKPSLETYSALVSLAFTEGSFDGGDQGLLNTYFADWATREDNTRRLPFIYNMTLSASYFYRPAYKQYGKNVRIVHFIGSPKPWQQASDWSDSPLGSSVNELAGLWWALFSSYVRPRLSTSMRGFLHDGFLKLNDVAPSAMESPAIEAPVPEQTANQLGQSSKEPALQPYPYLHGIPMRQGLPEKTVEAAEPPAPSPAPHPAQGECLAPPVSGSVDVVGLAGQLVGESSGAQGAAAGGDQQGHHSPAHHHQQPEGPQLSTEEVTALRRQAWERGEIDYKGQDSFDNLLEKMQKTLTQSTKK